MTKTYIPNECDNDGSSEIHAADWSPISRAEPERIAMGGVSVSEAWHFSHSAMAFRQRGSNSNGQSWERWYPAVEYHDAHRYPSHTMEGLYNWARSEGVRV